MPGAADGVCGALGEVQLSEQLSERQALLTGFG
jgi:hypothetical protein